MNDREHAKKDEEVERLNYFLESYKTVTGNEFIDIDCSETPDFLCIDSQGETVGIEITQVKFRPDEMQARRILERQEWADDVDVFCRLIELLHKKEETLGKGKWGKCTRKILVIFLVDTRLKEIEYSLETDKPSGTGFDEVWVADLAMLEMFYGVDIFPLVHEKYDGLFDVASRDQKPYG